MYEQFFEMKNTPFARDIPPEELYESPYVANALGRLTYAADRQLFAVVTADAGCGKSTLIRSFVASLPREEYIFLYLSDSKLTPRWFYKGLLDQLGIESKFYRGDAKRQLQKEVEIIRGVQKKKVVCILDEAHLLEKETIEEFRFLLLSLIENNKSYTQSEVILNLARKTVCKSYLSDKIEDNLTKLIRRRPVIPLHGLSNAVWQNPYGFQGRSLQPPMLRILFHYPRGHRLIQNPSWRDQESL